MRRLLLVFAVASSLSAADALSILQQRCEGCHGASLAQSGLRLDSREAALKGGAHGPALVPGDAATSRLVQAVRRTGELAMPPGPKLPDADIAAIEKWVSAGAVWPGATAAAAPADLVVFPKAGRPAAPSSKDPWVRTPIDAFIAKKLAEEKLEARARSRPRAR